jgi:cytolysin-activating lysine-acyltransferase
MTPPDQPRGFRTDLLDQDGKPLPAHEAPTPDFLRVLGDFAFLALRSRRHRPMTLDTFGTYLQPALLSGQFRVFRFDDVPRAAFTWAHLSPEGEQRLITGAPLTPEDWVAGNRLWVMDFFAPYPGLTQQIVRWIMVRGNLTDDGFFFRRMGKGNDTRRVVQIDFTAPDLARVWSHSDFLDDVRARLRTSPGNASAD